jgi:adenylate cyclase class 2
VSGAGEIEAELKIPVTELGGLRAMLERRGARLLHPALRERNTLLDTSEGALERGGRALRLRSLGDRHLLTYKGPVSFRGAVKERREVELDVGDAEAMTAILAELGLRPVIRYEKDREAWSLEQVVVTLDHTPMGDFVELEGAPDRLPDAAVALGLDPAAAVRGSYLGLWQEHRRRHPELDLPRDMVFQP